MGTIMKEAAEIFAACDKNKDGCLDPSELSAYLSDAGMFDKEIMKLFAKLDTNGDGKIDQDEWSHGFAAYRQTLEWRRLDREILLALAAARADPAACAARIEARLGGYSGKNYQRQPLREGAKMPPVKVTKEGEAVVHDALKFLSAQPPLEMSSEQVVGLQLSAADHVADIGAEGVASHTGSDESGCWDRSSRYGEWAGAVGECLWYGRAEDVSGESIIDDLIIDDGVPSRGHRLAVFDERYRVAGVSIGAHTTFGDMVAIEFAAEYTDNPEAIAQRIEAGPPPLDHSKAKAGGTAWDLGTCRGCGLEIKGGRVVEVPKLGKWHVDCFVCSRCEEPLAGVKQKKEEKKRLFCQPCWVELYAKTCFVCGKKISGDRITKGDTYRHPKCKPPKAGGGRGGKPGSGKGKTIGAGALADMYGGLDI